MKAAIIQKYGAPDVLEIKDISKPEPKKNEVLVRVKATAVTAADYRIRGANFPKGFGVLARLGLGILKPRAKVLGSGFSGFVEEVGEEVKDFKVGDKVFGMTGIEMGAYAEYLTIKETDAIIKRDVSIENEKAAASVFGGTTALYFLEDLIKIKPDENILINGASGSVGSAAVQIAKKNGATVTAVCSGKNAEFVKSLGADSVIDYKKEDFREDSKRYSYVMDVVGNISLEDGKKLLKDDGTMLLVVADLGATLKSVVMSGKDSGKKLISGTAPEEKKDLIKIQNMILNGDFTVSIDKTYDLEEIVEAHTYADTGRKVGNISIRIK